MSQSGTNESRSGLRGEAAVVGFAEWESERKHTGSRAFQVEQWADLAAQALADAGIDSSEVDGLVCCDLRESTDFVPATIAEYCGWQVNFDENVMETPPPSELELTTLRDLNARTAKAHAA